MAKLLKLRRGTTTQHGSFTGAEGEVTVDTDKETLVVHDGSTAGGHPVAAEDMANVSAANIKGRLGTTLTNAEINGSAAIAGTKISPDFGSQNITTDGNVNLPDNSKIQFGASNDLQIFHDGNHSRIKDTGTGDMVFHTNTVAFRDAADSENIARFNEDGDCQLFHDNTLRLQTTSSGVKVSGHIDLDDDNSVRLGNSQDFLIYHNGSHSIINDNGTGDLQLVTNQGAKITLQGGSDTMAEFIKDGAVDLYYDNSPKFNTASYGVNVVGNMSVTGTVDGRDVASDGSKLDGIEASATADQTAAEIRTLVESASDSNVFTDADHSKLNGIESGATADQSNAEIRAAVEAASDSNVFTDADHSKLNGIESGATADQTGAEIASALGAQSIYTTGNIGRDANDHIAFTDNTQMDIYINNNNEFRFEADGDFHADGDVYAFSTTVSSDENLKKDITIVSDAVTKVEALKGVTFKWKKNDADSAGVIAQDVEKVLPEVVKTVNDMDGNEFKAVNYAGLTSILIEAVKDLSARIKVLEAK